MIANTNRVFLFSLSLLFLAGAGCYAYWQNIYFLLIPFILLIAVLTTQHPEYLFYLLMISIPWSIEYNFNPGLGTDLPDEPLMLLASAAIIFYLAYHFKKLRRAKMHPLFLLILLQLVWAAITVITSTDVMVSSKYLFAKIWYLLAFLVLPLVLFNDEKIFKRSIVLLLFSMMAAMCVTLIRHWQYGMSFEKINDALEPFFRNHVNYSALLVFMVPVQIALLTLSSSKKLRFLFGCLLAITIGALYFSYARGAWLALITGLLSYWLVKKKLLLLSFLAFFILVIGGVLWLKNDNRFIRFSNDYKSTIFHSNFREHMVATYKLKDLSNAERVYRWVAAVRMIKDSWRTGFGPSTFYRQYKSYTLPAFKTYVSKNEEHSTVHNYFLLLLIEQGVFGCLLFICLIVAVFWYVQKIYDRTGDRFWKAVVLAAASVLVMECTINFLSDMIETDKAGSVFYLCIATIIMADVTTKRKTSNLSSYIQSIS